MDIDIRSADEKDISKIMEIDERCFPHNVWQRDKVKNYIERYSIAVACRKEKIFGFISAKIYNSNVLKLTKLAVDPHYQRFGIGTQLTDWIIDQKARSGEISKVWYWVRKSNNPSYQLCKNRDSEIVEEITNFYDNGEDAYKFEERIK
jgi:ribosomal protein S18 acetylase RimI-like enzyme